LLGKRVCVPNLKHIKELILKEAHDSAYSFHPGSTKMYKDLKPRYGWYGMKQDVMEYMALSVFENSVEGGKPDLTDSIGFWKIWEKLVKFGKIWPKHTRDDKGTVNTGKTKMRPVSPINWSVFSKNQIKVA
jgi:hypothetical protein